MYMSKYQVFTDRKHPVYQFKSPIRAFLLKKLRRENIETSSLVSNRRVQGKTRLYGWMKSLGYEDYETFIINLSRKQLGFGERQKRQ